MEINTYSMIDVTKKAPERPGVYVWYCSPCIGLADIRNNDSLQNLLDSYTVKFGRQQMSVSASLNFDLKWEGCLAPGEDDKTSNLYKEGFSERSRLLVSQMIKFSQPIFFQPLYIGKAEVSLRSRLKQHVSEFMRLKELIGALSHVTYDGEDDFAQRAVSLGYNEDQLTVHTIDVGNAEGVSVDEVRRAIRLVEMYLNKWTAPLLGRR